MLPSADHQAIHQGAAQAAPLPSVRQDNGEIHVIGRLHDVAGDADQAPARSVAQ
jgi:hypothetical protein